MIDFFKKLFGGGTDLAAKIAEGALIIDVRTPAEFRSGHVAGSRNVPLSELGPRIKELKKKQVPVITCCASGRRSGMAARQLKQEGIEAYNGGPWHRVAKYLKK